MKNYKKLIDAKNIPGHVAIIMDGNGRWAKKKSLPRSEGHRQGSEIIEPLMDSVLELGIKAVSLYAFSTENWLRPRSEVTTLWKLLEEFFIKKLDIIRAKGIRITHSGLKERLPSSTRKVIDMAMKETSGNRKLILNFCINYGGRQEIIHAVNRWLASRKKGETMTMGKLEKNLFTYAMPPVDLVIRTSGEFRISNFLIWQIAYSELVFLDVLWPDFRPYHLYKSIYQYQLRKRRYGGL